MKRLFAAILCLCLLAGCGRTDSTGNTCRAEDEPTVGAEKAEPIGESFRIIQEKPDWLLLAKEEGGSAEVYTLSLRDVELTLDGEAFERNEPGAYQRFPDGTLTGALVEVAYDLVLETYPGQLAEVTAVNIRSDGFDDRCALYLRVLNDLWAVDEGLNSDITMLSVDLSQTGLSDSEQAAGSVGIRRDARYFRDHDHELRGIGGGGVSLRHGPGGRRDPPLEGRLPVHHCGAGGRKQWTRRYRGHRDL